MQNNDNDEGMAQVSKALSSATRIAIATHRMPDGDAVGSAVALCLLLRGLGKTADVVIDRDAVGTPSIILEGFGTYQVLGDLPYKPDMVAFVDCANADRVAPQSMMQELPGIRTVSIDHHFGEQFTDLLYAVPDYSSAGELVYNLAMADNWAITPQIADALWVAIVTDTGRFSYKCTRPSTLRCAAHLVECGARYSFLNDAVYCQIPKKVMDIRAIAEGTLESHFDGFATTMYLKAEDYAATGCKKADTELFPEIPRSVAGTSVAIFLYVLPEDPSTVHASLRSRENARGVSALDIATHLGGGGHTHSSGATVHDTTIEAIKADALSFIQSRLAGQ